MTPTDWLTGVIATALLCAAVVRRIRTTESQRRARDRRELLRRRTGTWGG
jgi:hypothetical protein